MLRRIAFVSVIDFDTVEFAYRVLVELSSLTEFEEYDNRCVPEDLTLDLVTDTLDPQVIREQVETLPEAIGYQIERIWIPAEEDLVAPF